MCLYSFTLIYSIMLASTVLAWQDRPFDAGVKMTDPEGEKFARISTRFAAPALSGSAPAAVRAYLSVDDPDDSDCPNSLHVGVDSWINSTGGIEHKGKEVSRHISESLNFHIAWYRMPGSGFKYMNRPRISTGDTIHMFWSSSEEPLSPYTVNVINSRTAEIESVDVIDTCMNSVAWVLGAVPKENEGRWYYPVANFTQIVFYHAMAYLSHSQGYGAGVGESFMMMNDSGIPRVITSNQNQTVYFIRQH